MAQQLKPWVVSVKKYGMYAIIAILIGVVYYFVKNSAKNANGGQKVDNISMAAGFSEDKITTSNHMALPDFNNPVGSGTAIRWQIMAWNSQFPLMYANGGVRTSKGSLFASAGINCEIVRQDDCNQTIKDFQENAQQLEDGKTQVPLIVSFMGDGVPGMSSALNAIRKLGKNHRAIAFYSMGRSNGEDAFWGPADWKVHPEHCLGKGVVGVERDGDLNIVLKWASDNGVRVNANTKVYDSNALNIIACSDFNVDLCSKILNHYTEERDVISNGKTVPNLKHTLECDAFTTWTPVDVTIATKMGGFAKLASTAEYTMQMPNISIIDAAWAETHPNEMHSIIKALGIAGDQVRSFTDAQEFAAKVSAKVYNEKDANYWLKYYRGSEEADKKGVRVKLGGSQAFNLADAAMLFGLGSDNVNRYKITYETFGTILSKMYPKEMEGMISHDEMVDISYLQFVLQNNDSLAKGKTEQSTMEYASGSTVTDQTSQKTYNISFALGSDVINNSSYSILDDIYNSAQISGGLTIFVYGHTDNIGDQKDGGASNMSLSKRRAQSVSNYLQKKGLTANRIQVEGYGSTKPVYGDASNSRNRCVEIIQGK